MEEAVEHIDRSQEMDERSWWDLWNASYRAEDHACETSSELFAHVATLVRQTAVGGRILEIACGTGTLSRSLNFPEYHGLDISPAAIEIARTKAAATQDSATGITRTYEAADFHDWPLPPEPFDVVLCVDAISCFREQAFVMAKMAQALRRGGVIVLTTVNPFVYNRIRRVGGVKLENGPVSKWLSRRELHHLGKQAGLRLERSYTIMPRGNMGMLRLINSPRLDRALGTANARTFRRMKERAGLGQYRVVVARKP